MPAEITRRSTIAATLEQRGTTVFDLDKGELFDLVSKNDDALTRADFDKLYSVISEQAKQEAELKDKAARDAVQASKRAKLLGFVAIIVTLFLGLSVAANFLSVLVVVDSQIKTTAEDGALTTKDGSGHIMQTAAATESVPLYVVPVLPDESLYAISSVAVSYKTGENTVVKAQLTVAEVRKYNSTYVELITALPGRSLKIINGEAAVVQAGTNLKVPPKVYPVCSANATCSSIKVHSLDAEQLRADADAELAKVGVSVEKRRQLKMAPIDLCPIVSQNCGLNGWASQIYIQEGFDFASAKYCPAVETSDIVLMFHGFGGDYYVWDTVLATTTGAMSQFSFVAARSATTVTGGRAWQSWDTSCSPPNCNVWDTYNDDGFGVDQASDFLSFYFGSFPQMNICSRVFAMGYSDGSQLSMVLNIMGTTRMSAVLGSALGAHWFPAVDIAGWIGSVPTGETVDIVQYWSANDWSYHSIFMDSLATQLSLTPGSDVYDTIGGYTFTKKVFSAPGSYLQTSVVDHADFGTHPYNNDGHNALKPSAGPSGFHVALFAKNVALFISRHGVPCTDTTVAAPEPSPPAPPPPPPAPPPVFGFKSKIYQTSMRRSNRQARMKSIVLKRMPASVAMSAAIRW